MDLMQDILEEAKADEEQSLENLLFLLDTPGLTLCKAIVAWQKVRVETDLSNAVPPDNDRLRWLWGYCRYDAKQFASILGVKIQEGTELVQQLRDLSLIYPDGSVTETARKLVNSRIRKEMSKFVKLQ